MIDEKEKKKDIKYLRKICLNKKEFQKAKNCYLKYGKAPVKLNGVFDEQWMQIMIGEYKEDPELAEKCNRCGKCCIFIFDDMVDKDNDFMYFEHEKCCYLVEKEDGTTECSIYDHPKRLGITIGKTQMVNGKKVVMPLGVCVPRERQKKTWPDCPYNHLVKKNAEEWKGFKEKGLLK